MPPESTPRLLIDANLPDRFNLWTRQGAIHVKELGENWSDTQIWLFAREHNLTIVTQDDDFARRIRQAQPPPRVIRLRIGNMPYRPWRQLITQQWPEALRLSASYKLVEVFAEQLLAVI